MEDFLAFLLTSAFIVIVSVASAKKKAKKAAANGQPSSAKAAPRRNTFEEPLQKKNIAKEPVMQPDKEMQPPAEEGIAATDFTMDEAMVQPEESKPFNLDPEEMVVYSEIMKPKFEEY